MVETQKLSEIFKWIGLIFAGLAILFFPLGFVDIDNNSFTSMVLGIFGGGSPVGLIIFLLYSPVLIGLAIAFPIIAAIIYVIFLFVDKEIESGIKTLDWIAVGLSIASVVISGIYLFQWQNMRMSAFYIVLIGNALNPTLTLIWGFLNFLNYPTIKPMILMIPGILIIVGSFIVMLMARLKRIEVLKS